MTEQSSRVLLVTATEIEAKSIIKTFRKNKPPKLLESKDGSYHYLGKIKNKEVFLLESLMGSSTPGGAINTISKGILDLNPQDVILVGIAFGVKKENFKIGDILVSEQLYLYEHGKINKKNIKDKREFLSRGDKVTAPIGLINRVRSASKYWSKSQVKFGVFISGEKVINDQTYINEILQKEPEAIGGDMEANGLYVACKDKTNWIAIKAVCDFADGNKDKNKSKNQQLASRNASEFVFHILSMTGNNINKSKINNKNRNGGSSSWFKFVNRDEEQENITSLKNKITLFMVNAPIGYGKSMLLEKVYSKYKSKEWSKALITVNKSDTLEDIAKKAAKELKVKLPTNQDAWGSQLGGAWRNKYNETNPKSLVLLIDLDKEPNPKIFFELINKFIPDLLTNISEGLHYIKHNQKRVRVVLAGRNITGIKGFSESKNYPRWYKINLSPFTFDVISLSASRYLKRDGNENLSAHALHFTGGHPHCVSEYLKKYKLSRSLPDKFISIYGQYIWNNVSYPKIAEIRNNLIEKLNLPEVVVDAISVFRYLDADALELVYKNYETILRSYKIKDHFKLIDLLDFSSYYQSEPGNSGWYVDAMARRLVCTFLNFEKPDYYVDLCDAASKICITRIKQVSQSDSGHISCRWLVEYFNQNVQKKLPQWANDGGDNALKIDFFKNTVKPSLNLFFTTQTLSKSALSYQKQILIKELLDDKRNWDFKHNINYLFRGKDYTNEPFEDLINIVSSFKM